MCLCHACGKNTECSFIILLWESIKACPLFAGDIAACDAMSRRVTCDTAVLCHDDMLE